MRVAAACLLLASCSAPVVQAGGDAAAMAVADNISDTMATGWAYVIPDRRFDADSLANRLDRPAFLAGADIGYFADPAITRQYSALQLKTMQADHAGFVTDRDVDGDGQSETYRTGYWHKGDRDGTFLVVFDRGRQRDLVDTTDPRGDGVFMSWHDGTLVVADCNCAADGRVDYALGKLRVTWSDGGTP